MSDKKIIVRMAENVSIVFENGHEDVDFKKGYFYICEGVGLLSAQLLGNDKKIYFIPLEMIESGKKLSFS